MVQEERDCIGVDGIENLDDLARLVLINEECEKVVVDGGEFTRNANKKKKPDVL